MSAPYALSSTLAHVDRAIAHVDAAGSAGEAGKVHDGLPSFGEVLEGAVASANQSSKFASALAESFAAGARDDIHGTMLAAGKADIELKFVNTVRNKVIDAFYELWRMQI